MATVYSVLPIAGIDLNGVTTTNTNSAGTAIPTFGPLGAETFGSDGKRYVFAKAGASISASTTVCDINTTTFVVAATGGTYTSPTVALTSGQYAWFSKASV
jgi:hypothetical protein